MKTMSTGWISEMITTKFRSCTRLMHQTCSMQGEYYSKQKIIINNSVLKCTAFLYLYIIMTNHQWAIPHSHKVIHLNNNFRLVSTESKFQTVSAIITFILTEKKSKLEQFLMILSDFFF